MQIKLCQTHSYIRAAYPTTISTYFPCALSTRLQLFRNASVVRHKTVVIYIIHRSILIFSLSLFSRRTAIFFYSAFSMLLDGWFLYGLNLGFFSNFCSLILIENTYNFFFAHLVHMRRGFIKTIFQMPWELTHEHAGYSYHSFVCLLNHFKNIYLLLCGRFKGKSTRIFFCMRIQSSRMKTVILDD